MQRVECFWTGKSVSNCPKNISLGQHCNCQLFVTVVEGLPIALEVSCFAIDIWSICESFQLIFLKDIFPIFFRYFSGVFESISLANCKPPLLPVFESIDSKFFSDSCKTLQPLQQKYMFFSSSMFQGKTPQKYTQRNYLQQWLHIQTSSQASKLG